MSSEFVYTESTFSAFKLAPQIQPVRPLQQRVFHQVDDGQIRKLVAWHEFLIAALWALPRLSLDVVVIFSSILDTAGRIVCTVIFYAISPSRLEGKLPVIATCLSINHFLGVEAALRSAKGLYANSYWHGPSTSSTGNDSCRFAGNAKAQTDSNFSPISTQQFWSRNISVNKK